MESGTPNFFRPPLGLPLNADCIRRVFGPRLNGLGSIRFLKKEAEVGAAEGSLLLRTGSLEASLCGKCFKSVSEARSLLRVVTVARAGRIPREVLENDQPSLPELTALMIGQGILGCTKPTLGYPPGPPWTGPFLCTQSHSGQRPAPIALPSCPPTCHPHVQDSQGAAEHWYLLEGQPSLTLCFLLP